MPTCQIKAELSAEDANRPLTRARPLTVNVFVFPPHEQRSQHQQQQADTHTAHDQARVVLLLSQRHLAQMLDGVRLSPLREAQEVTLCQCQVVKRMFWPKIYKNCTFSSQPLV